MKPWWNRPRFDVVELLLVTGLVAVAVISVTSAARGRLAYVVHSAAEEGKELRARYGPAKYSRNEEEWVIRDYFRDRRGGYFVDVGANHYRADSNTYYLERHLGWSGVAVDPQAGFAEGYRKHRPSTRFFSFFVSDVSNARSTLHVVRENPLVASADQAFAERYGTQSVRRLTTSTPIETPTVRLTDLLDEVGVRRVDLLSIDVELAEPKVLAGFDIGRFRPALVCIEGHPQVRQQILDYFARASYVLVGRYLRADLQNLYFAPLPATPDRTAGRR